ncbi:hypothetical protein BDP55DRAFT_629983 [Colletotrichum godetiae]|uniref:Uncharacterized protein n=1 Tax=Colletotrichum godetiae TaxID=1209918 RepID=A0AAJ0AQ99_9PEZI|nr:uncharacterized protein BDP55DRAFT_629983 [Colletotrichum godetiae]KAK1688394.1 hypothetical protein BDP55DRAFT_629983 [Colletotrichum godetiae]
MGVSGHLSLGVFLPKAESKRVYGVQTGDLFAVHLKPLDPLIWAYKQLARKEFLHNLQNIQRKDTAPQFFPLLVPSKHQRGYPWRRSNGTLTRTYQDRIPATAHHSLHIEHRCGGCACEAVMLFNPGRFLMHSSPQSDTATEPTKAWDIPAPSHQQEAGALANVATSRLERVRWI